MGLVGALGRWIRWLQDLPLGTSRAGLGLALLVTAVLTALTAAAALIGWSAQLQLQLLGRPAAALAFPYLQAPLRLWQQPGLAWLVLGLLLAAGSTLAVLLRPLSLARRRQWWTLTTLLTLLIVATAVDVAFTEGNGAVMDALNARNSDGFWAAMAGLAGIYLLTLPLQFANGYGQQRVALGWRNTATNSLQRRYLSRHTYARLERNAQLDNPDQRLADDVDRLAFSSSDLLFGFAGTLLSLAAYILVLARISGWLLLALAVATAAGNGAIAGLLRRLSGLMARQQALEAHYRFALIDLRRQADAVAMQRGARVFGLLLLQRLAAALRNLERVIRWRELLSQSRGLYAFVMQFVPYLILATAYFAGQMSLGNLTVGSIAFAQVQAALSFVIDRAESFAALFASLERVDQLQAACALSPASITARHAPAGTALVLHNLSVAHPGGGGLLIEGLQLHLGPGERLLITGPNGCGKTSLLRVLSGVVDASAGSALLPPRRDWLALPQTPLLPIGSLRDQLTFPERRCPLSDQQLRQLLEQVGLGALSARHPNLNGQEDWRQILSGGEQQRLCIARLLLHQPRLALLDEATSATDPAAEQRLYGLLVQSGCALISVGHRPSLRRHHQRELQLDGRGGWQLLPIRG